MISNAEYKISTEYDGKKRKLFKKNCLTCNTEFWIPVYRNNKYCSTECYSIGISNKQEVECHQCGKKIMRPKKRVAANNPNNRSGLNFCSRKCKDYAQSIDGGCVEIQPKHYKNGINLNKNKAKGLKITGCVSCGETRQFLLDVHHIDGNRKNNYINNLECVCANCHKIRHLRITEIGYVYDNKYITDRSLIGVIV